MPHRNKPPKGKKKKAKVLILPNRLREKVGGRPGKTGTLNPDVITKAETKVEEISVQYQDEAIEEVKILEEAFAACASSAGSAQTQYLRKINRLVHDLRGQGASFGYPLLTEFAESLFAFTDKLETAGAEQLEIIKAHIGVIHVVAHQKMRGDGGEVGQQLKKSLKVAIDRYS